MTPTVRLSPAERLSIRLVTPRDVTVEFGISCRTQADLRERGQFAPVTRIGGRLYYRRELLEAWLDANTDPQPADADPPQLAEATCGP